MFDETGTPDGADNRSSSVQQRIATALHAPHRGHVGGSRSWSCLAASARIVHCEGSHVSERLFAQPTLLAILETIGGRLMVECGDCGAKEAPPRKAHLSLVPAGASVRVHAPRIDLFREVVIEILRLPSCATTGRACDLDIDFAPRTMIVDRDVLRIAELVAADCLSGHPEDLAYGDSLSIVLLKAIGRMKEATRPHRSQGGLAPWQLRRVTAFLEAHLVDGVPLNTLAELVDLSVSYLIRAFKVSTGLTPHQWLRKARVRRAQQLLVDGTCSLAVVAQETGFVDQAHLTRIFGQIIGESPGAWRRARLTGPQATGLPTLDRYL